jgi:hypothetical protein
MSEFIERIIFCGETSSVMDETGMLEK